MLVDELDNLACPKLHVADSKTSGSSAVTILNNMLLIRNCIFHLFRLDRRIIDTLTTDTNPLSEDVQPY